MRAVYPHPSKPPSPQPSNRPGGNGCVHPNLFDRDDFSGKARRYRISRKTTKSRKLQVFEVLNKCDFDFARRNLSKRPIRSDPPPIPACDATASRRAESVEEGVQRVFLSHAAHHHEASDGAFGVCDQGVCPVQGSAEVLHFQDRAPLRQQHNGRCLGRVSNDFSVTRRASALAEATFELASCDPSPSRALCQGVSHIPVAPFSEDVTAACC